ncbi:MAG: OprD family outer membrane porin [Kiritimatiellales bacterium]
MKKALLFVLLAALCAGVSAESLLKPVNDLGYGTWNARLQTLSMYRDYDNNKPGSAYSTTAGLLLGYISPELAGFSSGLTWIYVEPVDSSSGSDNGKVLISNGRVNVLNEAWIKYRFEALGLTNTFVKAGRQVVNGEVFCADEFRQKPRSVEAALLTIKDIPGTAITVGHAERLSNVWDDRNKWRFNDIEETLGAQYQTHGVDWAEAVYTGITNLEVAAYDAYAHDIANIAGSRARYALTDTTAMNGYYRHEADVGQGAERSSDMYGLSLQQKAGGVTLEPGFLCIRGDNLLFQELTTGINHPLGSSMMIYSGQFNGGSDTAYLKAGAKIGKTGLYALYNYTWQDHSRTAYDGQELNFVVKQPITDNLSVSLKVGAGYRDSKSAADDTFATDTRLFVTYNF